MWAEHQTRVINYNDQSTQTLSGYFFIRACTHAYENNEILFIIGMHSSKKKEENLIIIMNIARQNTGVGNLPVQNNQ